MKPEEGKINKPTDQTHAFKPLSKFVNHESHKSWCPLEKRNGPEQLPTWKQKTQFEGANAVV